VIQATKDIILKAVDSESLLKIEDEILGFLNQTPTQMLTHLRNRGGALDFADTNTLLAEQDREWDASEVILQQGWKSNPRTHLCRHQLRPKGMPRHGTLLPKSIWWIWRSSQRMGTETCSSKNMGKHQNCHLIGILKGKQAEQTYCKEVQSKQHQRASQSNGRTHCFTNQNPHAPNGNSNQKHNWRNEGNDVPDRKQPASSQQPIKQQEKEEEGRKAQEIQCRTYLQTLWKETSRQTRRQVLGGTKEQGLLPIQLEVRKEYLKV
jgi:hypothetical protein